MEKVRLESKLVLQLEVTPENGMGFHSVDIVLKNGLTLHNRIVVNSEYLLLNEGETIADNEIAQIKTKKFSNNYI